MPLFSKLFSSLCIYILDDVNIPGHVPVWKFEWIFRRQGNNFHNDTEEESDLWFQVRQRSKANWSKGLFLCFASQCKPKTWKDAAIAIFLITIIISCSTMALCPIKARRILSTMGYDQSADLSAEWSAEGSADMTTALKLWACSILLWCKWTISIRCLFISPIIKRGMSADDQCWFSNR